MKTRIAAAVLLVLLCPVLGVAQKAMVPTVVHLDKTVDFTTFHTYSYEPSHPAILKEVDARIVAGIEAQLKALGLTKAASGKGDIVVTYHSVSRTDVDLSTFDKVEPAPGGERKAAQTLKVGTLAVDVNAASTGKLAWRGKVEKVFSGDAATQLKTVDEAVVAVFGVYPTKTAKK
jgi:hypothetical protein